MKVIAEEHAIYLMWTGVVEMKGYHFLYALRDATHDKTYLGRCFFVAVLWEPEV